VFNSGLLWAQPAQTSEVFERVEALMQAAQQGRLAAVSAVVKETGQWVGLFRFLPHAANPLGAVEMGIWMHPVFWHGRVSLELCKACVDAAFSLSDARLLVGAASPTNHSSNRLLKLIDLVPVRTVWRKHETLGDVELIEHELTRQQWLAQRAQEARGGRKVFEQVVLPGWNGAAPPAAAGRLATVRPLQAPLPVPPVPQPEHFREELEELCEAA
jgi:RimJ/RimL family protein N-acetyltransferase